MKILNIILPSFLLIIISSCTDYNVNPGEVTNMEQLSVPADFNYNSVWNLTLDISDPEANAVYEIYSLNSTDDPEVIYTAEDTIIRIDNSNQLITKAILKNGTWSGELMVPGHQDFLYLRRKANGAYSGIPLEIMGDHLSYSHTGMKAATSNDKDVLYVVNYKKQWYSYDLETGELISSGSLPKGAHAAAIDKANGVLYFLNYQKPRELLAMNLSSGEISEIGKMSKAHIRMSYHPAEGLLYLSNKKQVFTYDPFVGKYMARYKLSGDSNSDGGGDICINADGNVFIASKKLYALNLDGNNNLANAVGSNFPAVTNGADFGSDGFIYGGRGKGTVYKINPTDGTATTLYNLSVTVGDFAILLKDAEAVDPDIDGDGVPNDSDDYPEDPLKAFNSYFPGEKSFGTLAFEDLWPSRGDYDFNDMIVDYRFKHIKNASDRVVELDITIQLRAIGGSLANGFGIQLPVAPSKISSVVSDYSFSGDIVSFDDKGLEADQSLATIIFFENGFNILQHPGQGTGINTSTGNPYVEPAQIDVSIVFAENLTLKELGNAPNNPFIFSSNERGKEIHIPGYAPTSLVNTSYFGTGDDRTDLANEYYYKTARGLPWGMNIPNSFTYPLEKVPIIDGYINFSQWATSGGYSFMDWYDDVDGYRNEAKLFFKPN